MDRASVSGTEDLGSNPSESTIIYQLMVLGLLYKKMVEVAGVEPACPVLSDITSTCLAGY